MSGAPDLKPSGSAPFISKPLTAAMIEVIRRAVSRERGNYCPMRLHANAETMMIEALDRRGFITWDHPEGFRYSPGGSVHHGAPRVNDAARAAIGKALPQEASAEAHSAGASPKTPGDPT